MTKYDKKNSVLQWGDNSQHGKLRIFLNVFMLELGGSIFLKEILDTFRAQTDLDTIQAISKTNFFQKKCI